MNSGRSNIIAIAVTLLGACNAADPYAEAKASVSRDMLDPQATQFREIATCSSDEKVVAGEFNAKNSFGAYTGFKPFFYADGVSSTLDDGNFMEIMERCHGKLKSSS